MARAQASDGGVGGRGGDDSGDGEDEVDLTGIATKEEKQAGTSGAWQTDVEKFLGMWDLFFFFCLLNHTSMCLGIKLAWRGSAVRNTVRTLTQDIREKSANGTYNSEHSGFVTRGVTLCNTSQTAALNTSASRGR